MTALNTIIILPYCCEFTWNTSNNPIYWMQVHSHFEILRAMTSSMSESQILALVDLHCLIIFLWFCNWDTANTPSDSAITMTLQGVKYFCMLFKILKWKQCYLEVLALHQAMLTWSKLLDNMNISKQCRCTPHTRMHVFIQTIVYTNQWGISQRF